MVRSFLNTRPFTRTKAGFVRFIELIANKNLPITMQISGLQMNGIFTIHSFQIVPMFKCLTNSSDVVYLSEDDGISVVVIALSSNGPCYKTMEELRKRKKEEDIEYFVCTKNIKVDEKTFFEEGQVFMFAPHTLMLSFKRERKRGINLLVYPEMNKVFFPTDTQGDFRKCSKPYNSTMKPLSLSSFPFYITLSNSKTLRVTEKSSYCCYFASTRISGKLSIHAFTVNQFTHAKILDNSRAIDNLDENELKVVSNSIIIPRDERIENFHCIRTYQELGIVRLLEEIYTELNNTLCTSHTSTPACVRREKIFENDYESLGNIIKNIPLNELFNFRRELYPLRNSNNNLVKNPSGSIRRNRESCNIYVNDSPHADEIKSHKKKELIVEFDTGGYVIIPFTKKASSISFKGGNLYYKSCENQAYVSSTAENLKKISEFKNDDHEYSYISLDDKSTEKKVFTQKCSDKNDSLPVSSYVKDMALKKHDLATNYDFFKTDNLTYDYPYSDYLSLKYNMASQNGNKNKLENLSVTEVSSLLRLLSLKHLIDRFQEKSVNGKKLVLLKEKDFISMSFTRFEARKLNCYIKGWRSCKEESVLGTWLTKSPKRWSVSDLSQYLLHVNMRSLLRFITRHQVDGFLFNEILKDDVIESLGPEHGVLFKEQDIEKLKKFFLDDRDSPRFELIR